MKDDKREKKIEKLKEIVNEKDYSTKENEDLDIPSVPEPPKKKEKLTIDSPDLAPDVLERIKKVESPNMKVVLVNCERCKAVIPIPVPKKVVIESEIPIVPVSYVHKNLENKDQHCITIHLDHDFDIRRQRLSDVVIASD
ncbi:MAG: hypothetical protein KGD58_12940 [Candidatus Lokiarchaeota archaeon]|nr:hypothetical protein [Candidatus Lokiarchaeota archaeon]